MNNAPTLSTDLLTSWNASYNAAAKSPILAALRLGAADVDALARVVASRCVLKSMRGDAGACPAERGAQSLTAPR